MLDTLEVKAKASIDSHSLKKMQISSGQNVVYVKPGGQNATSYSYRIDNNNRMPRIKYVAESNVLTVTIPSLGYYMFGSSIIPFNEIHIDAFYAKIQRDIQSELNITFHEHPSRWEIVSLDVCYDFNVGAAIKEYLYALRQHLYIDKRYKQHTVADETVAWRCGTKEIRFYDKGKKAKDTGEDSYTTNNSKGILRFECGIKRAELKRKFGSATIQTVVTDRNIYHLLIEHLNMVGKWDGNITNEVELYETIRKFVKNEAKASSMMWYIRAKTLGINLNHSRSTKQNYEKEFKKMGIFPVIINKKLAPLKIELNRVKVKKDSCLIYNFNESVANIDASKLVAIPKNKYIFKTICS